MDIKFRVWDLYERRFTTDDIRLYHGEGGLCVSGVAMKGLDFQHSTFLFDIKGKEIYEGDILRRNYDKRYYFVVKWFDGGFKFFANLEDEEPVAMCFCEHNLKDLKIDGNVNELPDFLRQKTVSRGEE